MAVDIAQTLAFASRTTPRSASASGVPPIIRVDGDMKRINMPPLSHKEVHSMVYDIMNRQAAQGLREFSSRPTSRSRSQSWRAFASMPSTRTAARAPVFRNIPSLILSLEELNTPRSSATCACCRADWCW